MAADRAACAHCRRPQSTCLCALARPTAHRTRVLVLQHPHEQRQAKNSVALLRLCLEHCEVVVGERFAQDALAALLQHPGHDTRLLYPDVPAARAPSTHETTAGTPVLLVVIDATWRKSLRMLLEHPLLAALPRMSLHAPAPTRYRAIRAARRARPGLDARGHRASAGHPGGPAPSTAAPVLDAFGRFVDSVAARRPT